MLGFIREFRNFAFKGNMIDLAVGVIVGAAFGSVVTSLTKDVITPMISYVTPSLDFKDWHVGRIMVGNFLNALIAFVIQAWAIFLLIKTINTARKRFEAEQVAAPAVTPADVVLLTEIRDLLKQKQPALDPIAPSGR